MRSLRRRGITACLLVIALAIPLAGCTRSIAGEVRPAANLKPRPLVGEPIKQVLLDDAGLSKILTQTFTTKSDLPPRFGGPEKLQVAYGMVTPVDCVGVTTLMEKSAYQSADVKNVARETWWNAAGPSRVISVTEGVVALPSVGEASALFDKFSQQWNNCNGTTVTIDAGAIAFSDSVSDVRVANAVLAATLAVDTRLAGAPSNGPRPEARAIGFRANCLVEVDIAFFSTQLPEDQGSGDLNTSAIDIAHLMMDKVTQLT
ncbi:MAG: sensor domain-containing protein [Mycobacterium sp.]